MSAAPQSSQPEAAPVRRCPIENPHYCIGTRCQLFGVCDFNRQPDRKAQP